MVAIKNSARKLAHTLLLPALIAGLSACVSTPNTKPLVSAASQSLKDQHQLNISAIQQFSLQGRIGVQTNSKGFSGSLRWQHNNINDDIALYSPLGGQVASIKKNPAQITLEDTNGKSIAATDAESLTQSALGWQLPLTGLADWSLGRPTKNTIQASTWDERGLLSTLSQDGWSIEYQNYSVQNGYLLPNKILLKSDKVNLKLLVDTWSDIGL